MAQASTGSKTGEGGGWISEDWLALILGLIIFGLGLGSFQGNDYLGWGAKTGVWINPTKAVTAISTKYQTVAGEITKIDGQKITVKRAMSPNCRSVSSTRKGGCHPCCR
jgi:hypothetical protein